ncbi:BnaUnng02110D, partial [Brassica napus]
VREEETSKKKRRLSEKKKKRRRRLAFAVVMDIELVAIYTCQRHPCFSFSDPSFPVSVFTVVATTTACHHTEESDGGGGNKTVMWLEDVAALEVTGLWGRRKKTIMTSRHS